MMENVRTVMCTNHVDLLSVSADKSVAAVDVEKNKTKWQVTNAHKHPLNTFIVCDENLIATGDDEGYIKVWDLRQRKCAASFEENGDYITDFDYHDGKDILYATSGDGCMSVFSLRKGAVIEVTNQSKQDFLSVRNMHRGEKVVVGTGKGNLLVFKDDNWEHYNAKFATGLSSVDCLLFATEELVVAGSADGYIRSYKIGKPKIKMVHQIASEQDAINQISLARDGKYIASCGDDNVVKFWNSAMLFGMDLSNEIEKEEEQEEKNENNKRPAVTEAKQQPQTKKRKPQNSARKEFFSELLGSYKDVKK
jgi:WD40 repeat protein